MHQPHAFPVPTPTHSLHAMQYKVVAAQSEEGLSTSATAVLCRLRDWSTKNCTFALPPLRNTYFAVQPTDTGLIGEAHHARALVLLLTTLHTLMECAVSTARAALIFGLLS